MNTVLFACVHNAGRSQMTAALFNALIDPARTHAISAGTRVPGPPYTRKSWPRCTKWESISAPRDAVRSRVAALVSAEGWGRRAEQ